MTPKSKRAAARDFRKHKNPTIINDLGRTCNCCGHFNKWCEYYKSGYSYTGYIAVCKECKKADNRARYVAEKASEIKGLVNANKFLLAKF